MLVSRIGSRVNALSNRYVTYRASLEFFRGSLTEDIVETGFRIETLTLAFETCITLKLSLETCITLKLSLETW